MKSVYKIALLAFVGVAVSSCFNDKKPNYQYMPQMYQPVGYETYSESNAFLRGGVEAQLPPTGTLKRGFEPYDFENTEAGYEASKANPFPLDSLAYDEDQAKELYTIYCGICHGEKGDGKGYLDKQGKFLGVPSYKDRAITVGSVYHVETYGRNVMGSYANQLSQKERWIVAAYVMKLKAE